ncbi:MAG: division/cell wall cluster transcriptional repressor MraZ [Deltaproteobacteria bacterium]|nr:division/cell wall cluster transcriptional repressor MraZ [Deltaproteobacteria bacterium]
MFRGRSKHNLDSKGRLAIPARFKEFLEQKGEDYLVVTNHDTGHATCLWAYPRDEWRVIEEKAAKLPQFNRAANNYLRYFISGAVECPLKNGRITLPPDLREIAGLEKEVMLVGGLIKFEIWEKDKWEKEFQRSRENFAAASESLSEFGI